MSEFADVVTLTRERYEEMKDDITESQIMIRRLQFTIKELCKDLYLKDNELRRRGGV